MAIDDALGADCLTSVTGGARARVLYRPITDNERSLYNQLGDICTDLPATSSRERRVKARCWADWDTMVYRRTH